jgi:voltage-gated potassium channel
VDALLLAASLAQWTPLGRHGVDQPLTSACEAFQERGGCSGRGASADNPYVTTVEPEILTPAGRRWVERAQRPLDVLAVIFLIDVILIWSFPDASPAVLDALNIIVLIVWACFALDYVARLLLSVQKGRFVRTHKLDLLMVLLPMLRLLRVFLLLRRSLASVSTERIAGSIVSLVIVAMFVSAFFMWRVEHNAPGATITTFRYAIWWAIETTTTVGYGDYTPVTAAGRIIATAVMVVGVGLIGTVSASVASWFVKRHSEPGTELDDVMSADGEPGQPRPPTHRPRCWIASTNLPPSRMRFARC